MAAEHWAFDLPDGPHTIELRHGRWLGRRKVLVDGQPVAVQDAQASVLDRGGICRFRVGDRQAELRIEPRGVREWHYALQVGELVLTPPLPAARTPWWAVGFVALCLAPLALLAWDHAPPIGIALAAMMGAGGALACLAASADPKAAAGQRVGSCVALVAVVWGILALPGLALFGASTLLRLANP